MPRDASGRIIPGSYGPGRSGENERALQPFGPQTLSEYQGRHDTQKAIGGPGIDFRAAGINPQVRNINVQRAMVGEEPVDERFEPGSHLEDQELTEKYRQIQAAYPGVSQKEIDSIYQQYQKDLHFGERQGEEPQRFEDWLQQHKSENLPQESQFGGREVNQELPPELLARMQQGQQGPPMGGQYS